jgi:hypothetical protein
MSKLGSDKFKLFATHLIKYLLILLTRDAIYQTKMFLISRDPILPMNHFLKI